MKKLLSILVVLYLALPLHGQSVIIGQFGGNDTDNDALVLPNGRTPDSQNVNTDDTQGISPRSGFTRFSTETPRNNWVFNHSNGARYIIVQTSGTIKANTGSGNFTITISTVDPNVTTDGTQLGDRWYFSNVTDGLKYWDSNTLFTGSTTMKFTQLETYKGRLAGAGKPGSERTIFFSRFNDGNFWNLVTNPADDDPAQIQIGGGQLDEVLTTLYATHRDKLIWAKANSFGAISGSRRPSLTPQTYSEVVGTAYPETMRDCDGELRFLGSRRTIWGFDGANLRDLTRYEQGGGIRNLMATVVQGDATTRVWTQTTQSDWAQGKSGIRISTQVTSGDVVFVSSTADESFNGGTCSNPIGPCTDLGWIGLDDLGNLSVASGKLSGAGSGGAAWVRSKIAVATWTITGVFNTGGQDSFFFMALATTTDINASQGYRIQMLTSGGVTTFRVQYIDGPAGGNAVLISSDVSDSRALTVNTLSVIRTQTGQFTLFVDSVSAGSAVDTTFSSANFMSVHLIETTAKFDSISVKENIMFSTFTSQEFNIGNKITSWGVLTINDTSDGASIKHILYTANSPGINPFNAATTSQVVTSNMIPTISTAQYVLVLSSYSRTFSTQTPFTSDFTITWNEGSNLRASSIYTNQRYWLGVAISSTENNTVLVFDKRREWQKYVGINADAMVTYNSNPMFVNASGVWQAESGNSDNGSAISAYYKTKTLFPSGLPYINTFKSLFMTTSNNSGTLVTTYQTDGVNSDLSLASRAMDFVSGYQNFNLPFATDNLQKGRTISIKWAVSSTTNWRIIGAELFFDAEKIIRAN